MKSRHVVVLLLFLINVRAASGSKKLLRKFVHNDIENNANVHFGQQENMPETVHGEEDYQIHLRTRKFSKTAEQLSEENTLLRYELLIEETMSFDTTLYPIVRPTVGVETMSPSKTPIIPSPTEQVETLSPTREETLSPSLKKETLTPSEFKVSTSPIGIEEPAPPTKSPIVDSETLVPTSVPSLGPTSTPTGSPTIGKPSHIPTVVPTENPTSNPTSSPTRACNMSTEARESLMQILIKVVSNSNDVNTEGSPQNKAAKWIIYEDSATLCPQDDTFIQRYVIAVFYFSTRGKRWVECRAPDTHDDPKSISDANQACQINVPGGGSDAWLTPKHECNWGGIACNRDGKFIERIEFESNGVGGTLPFEIRSIQSLKELLLERGVMTGTIPQEIGDLQNLIRIDLDNNLIEGSIPNSLYSLTKLRQLDINDNGITGTISTLIGQLSSLSFFQINNNRLTGTIPTELGELSLLEVATLDNNNLQGEMPSQACSIKHNNLRVLTTDCLGAPNRPAPPFVSCSCCTSCF